MISVMVLPYELNYENAQSRVNHPNRSSPRVSYHTGIALGVIFAWWALGTAVDASDPFIAKGAIVDPNYFLNRALVFLPLLVVLSSTTFELCRRVTLRGLPSPTALPLDGPIIAALFLPSANFALIEGYIAYSGDIRFPCQITRVQFACLCIASLAAALAAGVRLGKSKRPAACWFRAGWAAPCVLVTNFEGFKYFGQYMTSSPGGVNEFSLGGFLYWTLAFINGLVAVPLFATLFLDACETSALADHNGIEINAPQR